jgi:lysophospholipase L1-like esterase
MQNNFEKRLTINISIFLSAMVAVLFNSLVSPLAFAAKQSDFSANLPALVHPTTPSVEEGLAMRVDKRTLTVMPGRCWVNDKKVVVPEIVKIEIPQGEMLKVVDEPLKFVPPEKKEDFAMATLLECRASKDDQAVLSDALLPPSLHLKAKPGAGPDYKPGVDYLVNPRYGIITLTKNSAIKPDQQVYADYQVWLRQIDIVAVCQDGTVKLISGLPSKSACEPPACLPDCLPLANIYCSPFNKPILSKDILPINAKHEAVYLQPQRKRNTLALSGTLAKLKAGLPVSIVFWGDSITAGADATDSEHRFAQRVIEGLKQKFPKAQIRVHNAGIGGSDTRTRLPHFQKEVLAYNPDLIIVEFINDIRLPLNIVKTNFEGILEQVQSLGIELIVIAPHFPEPSIVHAKSWDSFSSNPYILFLRKFSRESNVAFADVSARWEHLDRMGLRPDMVLVDNIIHPNNLGHQVYADEILKCFY